MGKETHQSMLEAPRIHHRHPRSLPRPPSFSSTRPDDAMDASQMEIKNIPSLVQSVKRTPEFPEPYKSETILRREPTSPFSTTSSESFQPIPSFHLPSPTSAPSFPQLNLPMAPSASKSRKPTIQYGSLDDWIDKLIPYQETVIPHKHRSDMTLGESLLHL